MLFNTLLMLKYVSTAFTATHLSLKVVQVAAILGLPNGDDVMICNRNNRSLFKENVFIKISIHGIQLKLLKS
jgi:hypothetical protein